MPSYFDQFPDFDHNPQVPLRQEFLRLGAMKQWGKGRRKTEWAQCCADEFGHHYGIQDKLQGWQALCTEVGVTDIPQSITSCKKILRKTWVNLVDLIDSRRTGNPVTTHRSRNALREYTQQTRKIFPKKRAKSNGFLKVLLIEIF